MRAKLINDAGSYHYHSTLGKVYDVTPSEGIFTNSPYFIYINDEGKEAVAHQSRFLVIDDQEASKNETI